MDAVTDLFNGYRENLESEAKLQKELRAAMVKQEIDSGKMTPKTAALQLLEEVPEINIEEEIAALASAYLNYEEAQPGNDEYKMYTYFFAEWEDGVGKVRQIPH
jgi:hypothetical protein